jgi:hypothetical protein
VNGCLSRQVLYYSAEPPDYLAHLLVVQLVIGIGVFMIMHISKEGSIGDHEGRITFLPERPIVGVFRFGDIISRDIFDRERGLV